MAVTNRILTDAELEPPYDDPTKCPKTITTTKRYHDGTMLYVAGNGPKPADVMFVASAVQEEEASESMQSSFGVKIEDKAEYLKGALGILFRDVALECGIDIDKCFYTAVVKWLMPTMVQRNNPPARALKWGHDMLMHEVKQVKPKIIVCLGKPALNALADDNYSFKDAHGCWLWSEKAQAHLYLMYSPHLLIPKPELKEVARIDLREIKFKMDLLEGKDVCKIPVSYKVIRTADELRNWVQFQKLMNNKLFSLDCEWHGATHVDGELRSVQLCWNDQEAIYIRFMDENRRYVFDCSYEEAGDILRPLLGEPDVKYLGHHYAADAVWMNYTLGLPVFDKCYLDTEFAQQTIDEHSELGLERGIAMRYTDMGRYNQDLIMWKRKNKEKVKDGYGYVPEDILIPYAVRDVVAVFRAAPDIRNIMRMQKLEDYYDRIFNPFVTDVFTMFALMGLPMDIPQMDDLRVLCNYAREGLDKRFKEAVQSEAKGILIGKLLAVVGLSGYGKISEILDHIDRDEIDDAWKLAKRAVGPEGVKAIKDTFEHYVESPQFNIRSKPMMVRWLFDVCEYTPVKSTNAKSEGRPSMAWDKVLKLPEERQKDYKPATDKQTLMIIAQGAPLVDELLNFNMVGNLCKAFLKEPELVMNEDGEWEGDETGIHKWLSSDGCIHGMVSTTATGRPRSYLIPK